MKTKDLTRKHRGFQIIHEDFDGFTVYDKDDPTWQIGDTCHSLEEAKSLIDSYISGALVEY